MSTISKKLIQIQTRTNKASYKTILQTNPEFTYLCTGSTTDAYTLLYSQKLSKCRCKCKCNCRTQQQNEADNFFALYQLPACTSMFDISNTSGNYSLGVSSSFLICTPRKLVKKYPFTKELVDFTDNKQTFAYILYIGSIPTPLSL